MTKAVVTKGGKVLIGDLKLTDGAQSFIKQAKNVKFAECDVTKWRDLENLITFSEKEFGDVPDVYVPGAGVFEPVRSAQELLAHTLTYVLPRTGPISGLTPSQSATLHLISMSPILSSLPVSQFELLQGRTKRV